MKTIMNVTEQIRAGVIDGVTYKFIPDRFYDVPDNFVFDPGAFVEVPDAKKKTPETAIQPTDMPKPKPTPSPDVKMIKFDEHINAINELKQQINELVEDNVNLVKEKTELELKLVDLQSELDKANKKTPKRKGLKINLGKK